MFRNIKIKLSFLCCFITALLAFTLVLCCLRIAEKSMYGQEEALFSGKRTIFLMNCTRGNLSASIGTCGMSAKISCIWK